MEHTTRKSTTPIKVYCLPVERALLKSLAANANLSTSTYLLKVGLGYRVPSRLDNRRVEELARMNGDLGRLGGLLKLWLTNDERTAEFGTATILALLAKIEATQDAMYEVMRHIVIPRSEQ
jgi:hypothetical protein